MIRPLVMIAIAGFVLCVASLTAAVAIGGSDALSRGGWAIASSSHDDWDWDDDDHDWDRDGVAAGPQATRTIEWSGAERLDVDLAADVRYIQAPGPATLTITGPQRAVERVELSGDNLRYEGRRRRWGGARLDVVLRAPNVSAFDLSGRNSLTIEGYDQPRLRLDVSGQGDVRATGRTDTLELDLSGDSDADLAGLNTKGADVDISGAADATIAPTDWAKLDISGAGDVRLTTHPARLETDVSGAGKVRMDGPSSSPSPSPSSSATPSPSGSPSPPPKPGGKV